MSRFFRTLLGSAGGIAGTLILVAMIGLALLADVLYPGNPWRMVADPNLPPLSPGYLLGSDVLGRDVAAGLVHGARVSLSVALIATAVSVIVGTMIGAVAGYFGGWVDDLLMRLTEFVQTIPGFLFSLVLVAILAPSIGSIVIAIAAVSWPSVARLVRAEFLSLRNRDFVRAAIVGGQTPLRIMVHQILPNALSPIIVAASLMVASAILLESAISFLGLGDRSYVSWGFMIGAGRTMILQNWWLSAFPGFAIFITVLGINLFGDALNMALNPRQSRVGRVVRFGADS